MGCVAEKACQVTVYLVIRLKQHISGSLFKIRAVIQTSLCALTLDFKRRHILKIDSIHIFFTMTSIFAFYHTIYLR
jgi:hypothetical protein